MLQREVDGLGEGGGILKRFSFPEIVTKTREQLIENGDLINEQPANETVPLEEVNLPKDHPITIESIKQYPYSGRSINNHQRSGRIGFVKGAIYQAKLTVDFLKWQSTYCTQKQPYIDSWVIKGNTKFYSSDELFFIWMEKILKRK